jgi:hypothetical protein
MTEKNPNLLETMRQELINQVSVDTIEEADKVVELLRLADMKAEAGQMFAGQQLTFCVVIPHTEFDTLKKLIVNYVKKETQ